MNYVSIHGEKMPPGKEQSKVQQVYKKKKMGFSKSTPKPLLSETQYNSFHPKYKPGGIAPLLKKKSEILRI